MEEWKYACVNRPPMFGAVPGGAIRHDPPDPEIPMARHGFVVYDRELTDEECRSYELYPHIRLHDITEYYLALFDANDAAYINENGNAHLKELMRGRFGSFAGGYTRVAPDDVVEHVTKALLAHYGYAE